MRCTTAAERRYLARTAIATSFYLVAMAVVTWAFHHRHPHGIWAYLLALAPALPILAVIAILGVYLTQEADEFVRAVMVQASLWATAAVLVYSTCSGLLETYVPEFVRSAKEVNWIFVIWFIVFGLAQPLIRRRYK
jgi:xanthosine utilization system XapX-like protein